MRNSRHSTEPDGNEWDFFPTSDRGHHAHEWQNECGNSNSPEEVLGEVALVLVVVLGIALATNMVLVALHIG